MTDELETTCMEVVVAYSRNYPSICLSEWGKQQKLVTLNDVAADIRIEHVSNSSPERYELLGRLTLHGTDSSKYYRHVWTFLFRPAYNINIIRPLWYYNQGNNVIIHIKYSQLKFSQEYTK
jgi:hypothetical protein